MRFVIALFLRLVLDFFSLDLQISWDSRHGPSASLDASF